MKRWRQMTAACLAVSMMFANMPAGALTLGEGGMGKIYEYHADEDDKDEEPLASPSDSKKEEKKASSTSLAGVQSKPDSSFGVQSKPASPSDAQTKPASPSDSERAEVKRVQKLIDALPTAEELASMRPEKQAEVYAQVEEAYDAYEELSLAEKQQIEGAEIFEELFAILNGQLNVLAEDNIRENVLYLNADGEEEWRRKAEIITEDSTTWNGNNSDEADETTGTGGWYVVEKGTEEGTTIEINERIEVKGKVYLILADGCTLNANRGIHVNSGASLTIYAQSTDVESMGKLISDASEVYNSAGIGGNGDEGEISITICGGNIEATGATFCAGIGSGSYREEATGENKEERKATITISGGKIDATGRGQAAGIGSGIYGVADITICGGEIEATGGVDGAGIGSGYIGVADIIVYDGKIKATGGFSGAGIGSGSKSSADVTIKGGNIIATGGSWGIGVGSNGESKGKFSTGDSGDAIIIATAGRSGGDGIEDRSQEYKWKGLIIENGKGKIYGDTFTLMENWEIPEQTNIDIVTGQTLIVNEGVKLTVPKDATIVNRGEIQLENDATLQNNGKLQNDNLISGDGHLTGNGKLYGTGRVADTVQNDFLKKSELTLTVNGKSVTSKNPETDEQAYSAEYGSTISVIASMTGKASSLSTRLMSTDATEKVPYRMVSFWAEDLGDDLDAAGGDGTKIALGSVEEVESESNWKKTATTDLILNKDSSPEGLAWQKGHWYRFTAAYGGSMTLKEGSEDSVLLHIVGKPQEVNPTFSETVENGTNSIKLSVSNIDEGQEGIEYAYVKGQDVSADEIAEWKKVEDAGSEISIDELEAGTAYTVFARFAGNDAYEPSETSQITVYTLPDIISGNENGALKDGCVGISYETQLEADTSDDTKVKWSIVGDDAQGTGNVNANTGETVHKGLPKGLNLDEDGKISGRPEEAGTFVFTVQADLVDTADEAIIGEAFAENAEIADSGVTAEGKDGELLASNTKELRITIKGVTIQFKDETISFDDTKLEVNTAKDFSGETIANNGFVTAYILTGEEATLYVRLKAEGETPASEAAAFTLPARRKAPDGVQGGYEMLKGISSEMEYRKKDDENWTDCEGHVDDKGRITGLDFDQQYEVRLKATDTAFASAAAEIKVSEDTEKPTGTITVRVDGAEADERTIWDAFVENKRFGIFAKEAYQVNITAEDRQTGVKAVSYAVSEQTLSENDVKAETFVLEWKNYADAADGIALKEEGKYVIYVRITDNSDNVTYLSSDGLILDKTAPIIEEIQNGGTYCPNQTFRVNDADLKNVSINGTEAQASVDGSYTLSTLGENTIVVEDKAGNKTECKVIIAHEWGETSYKWSEDGKSCTAMHTCNRDGCGKEETVKATVTPEQTKAPTCTEMGETTYTATFAEAWAKPASKIVQDIPALGHNWKKEANFAWDGFNKATATFTCGNDASHTNVVDAEVASTTKQATCEEDGEKIYTASVTFGEKTYTDSKTEVLGKLGHAWQENPSFKWNGFEKATATFTCANDASHTIVVEAKVSSTTKPATCEEDGEKIYTASVTLEGKSYTDSKTEVLGKLGHAWQETPSFTWDDDFEKATATFTCANDASHTKEVEAEITNTTKPATCEEDGEKVYTASVTFEGKTYTDTKMEVLEKLGHAWQENPSFKWNGFEKATATFTCGNDASHTKEVEAEVTTKTTKPVTCEEDGEQVYTASVTFEGKTYTDTKIEVVGKLGHAWQETPSFTWDDDFEKATATFTCANDASHTTVVEAKVISTTKPATCEEDGERIYTASVTFEGKTYTDMKTEILEKLGHNFGNWTSNGDGTHTGTCINPNCTQTVKETCSYGADDKCSVCGALKKTASDSGSSDYERDRSSNDENNITTSEQTVVDPRKESGLPYMDVAVTDWFYEAVKFVGEHKLMDGVSGTSFAPYEAISRAQLATGLYRLEGSPAVTERADFSDMRVEPGTLLYYDAVSWAWNNQLMSGFVSYDAGKVFGANELITREQLAVTFYNYAKLKGYDTSSVSDLAAFADREKVSVWALEAMRWAVGAGLIDGKENGLLEPQSTATRAETALVLKRFTEKYRSTQMDAPRTDSTGGNESR